MNNINLVGRLTGQPVLKTINAGTDDETQVSEFSIACERTGGRSDANGNKPVDYFDIRVWGVRAKSHHDHLVQGQRIHISGEVRQERWTDKETGTKRSKHVVIARDTEWLDKPRAANTEASPAQAPDEEPF